MYTKDTLVGKQWMYFILSFMSPLISQFILRGNCSAETFFIAWFLSSKCNLFNALLVMFY